jgi:hypothetical protein
MLVTIFFIWLFILFYDDAMNGLKSIFQDILLGLTYLIAGIIRMIIYIKNKWKSVK